MNIIIKDIESIIEFFNDIIINLRRVSEKNDTCSVNINFGIERLFGDNFFRGQIEIEYDSCFKSYSNTVRIFLNSDIVRPKISDETLIFINSQLSNIKNICYKNQYRYNS